MRVSLRRLQAALRIFKACYPPTRLRRHRLRLRRLLQALGAVRDQDILISALSIHAEASLPPVKEFLARLVAQRKTARRRDRVRLIRVLDKHSRKDFRKKLLSFIKGVPGSKQAPSGRRLAPTLVAIRREALSRWNRRQGLVQGRDDPETLHQIRIAVKWLRYTLELCQLANDHDDRGRLERLSELQRVLGDLHDSDILLKFLAESFLEAPVESIAGLADVMRIIKQGRQELSKRFSHLIGHRTLVLLIPARSTARHKSRSSTGSGRQAPVRA